MDPDDRGFNSRSDKKKGRKMDPDDRGLGGDGRGGEKKIDVSRVDRMCHFAQGPC